jgi:hypothetical protein
VQYKPLYLQGVRGGIAATAPYSTRIVRLTGAVCNSHSVNDYPVGP